MNTHHEILKRITKLGLLLMLGASLSACGGDSWKEEVLLHDGSKLIVERSQSYGGRREVGQTPPLKEQDITFTLPGTNRTLTWKSEYSEDIGRSNFKMIALHVLNGTPYIVAVPNLCLSYNKWGRPNPPYVFFKHDGKEWRRIQLSEFPIEFKENNLVINSKGEINIITRQPLVTAELVKKLNGELEQPEYRSILREGLTKERINEMCEERVQYKGHWILPNDPIARRFIDQQQKK